MTAVGPQNAGVVKAVVLVGMPGVGKSSVGRCLARIFGVPFADSDEAIERSERRTIHDIWTSDGEPAFRGIEERAIAGILDSSFRGVLALGGGAVLSQATRSALSPASIRVVHLQAELSTLTQRVGNAASRAVLADRPGDMLARLLRDRDALYEQVADVSVSTDQGTPEDVAAETAQVLGDRWPPPSQIPFDSLIGEEKHA